MRINNRLIICLLLIFSFNAAWAADAGKRLMLMDFKLMGAVGETKLDGEHQKRLQMANNELRKQLTETGQFDLVDEATSKDFNQKVSSALKNNACDSCELGWAKERGIQQILYPWVYKLSNLVLSLHVVIIDVAENKAIVKKVHDFRGDNDQGWQRAIRYYVENINKP